MIDARRSLVPVAVVALLLRLALLWIRGDYIVFDEGYYLLLARSLREGHGFTLNGLPHVALSPLQPLLVAGVSFTGIPDLWASRLLAAVCGAALVFPAAALARRWFGDRGAFVAGLVVAVFPSLLTFLPFFPGEGWNLYFGSEPLFLLLGVSALACAARALDTGAVKWWLAAGVLADLSYLTRLEGAVLGTFLGISLIVAYVTQKRPGLVRALLVYSASALITLPYLLYLHGALGRWAISGRVQAANTAAAPATPGLQAAASQSEGGSDAVNNFVWGGDVTSLWRTLYALDGSHTQMSSQYWGVPARPVQPVVDTTTRPAPSRPAARPSALRTFVSALATLAFVPFWILAVIGFVRAKPRADAALLLGPAVVTAIAPAVLAYAEPRALLMLVPVVCVLLAGALVRFEEDGALSAKMARSARFLVPLVVLVLLVPTVRDVARAWTQQTPLQRVATARRLVGEYAAAHLPDTARIVSWHPAVAIWAHRDWRVQPFAPLTDIATYALAQQAGVVVLSRFDWSPINNPPKPFIALLVDSSLARVPVPEIEPVDQTPYLLVGRARPR